MGGLIGELVLGDASLSALLAEMRRAVFQHGPVDKESAKRTTGELAKDLKGEVNRNPAISCVGFGPWLMRVVTAAEQRNEIVHAVGQDRCVGCGDSSVFVHKHKLVDRSEPRIRQLITEFQVLIDEGVELAAKLSDKLNELLLAEARERAAATGEPQFPAQIRIAADLYRCTACSGDGHAGRVLSAPAAVAVLPPGEDVEALYRALKADNS